MPGGRLTMRVRERGRHVAVSTCAAEEGEQASWGEEEEAQWGEVGALREAWRPYYLYVGAVLAIVRARCLATPALVLIPGIH